MSKITPERREKFKQEADAGAQAFDAIMAVLHHDAEERDLYAPSMVYGLWVSVSLYLFERGFESTDLAKALVEYERALHGQDKPS